MPGGVAASGPTLEQIIRKAFDEGYSDIHVGVGEVPRYRNRGEINATDFPVTTEAVFESWLKEILSPEDIQQFKDTLDFDGAAQYDFFASAHQYFCEPEWPLHGDATDSGGNFDDEAVEPAACH